MFSHSIRHALAATLALGAIPAFAGVASLQSPNVQKGELEIEYSGSSTFDDTGSKHHDIEHEFELEYGLTDRIGLEFEGELVKQPNHAEKYKVTSFGASFQFFEQGENWLDSGVEFTYGLAARDGAADSAAATLLLEKTMGKFVHTANYRLKQEVGENADGGPAQRLLWNSRYLYNVHFEPGFELQHDFGKTSDSKSFDQGKHYAGPSLYGEIAKGWKYEAAYYRGLSDAAATSAARVKLEYEMYF